MRRKAPASRTRACSARAHGVPFRALMAVALRQGAIETSGLGASLTALETRDSYTGRHWDAVLELAIAVGDHMG